jgi:putative transposase
VLKEIDNGATIDSVARAHGITDQTIPPRREKYAGMSGSELAELRALQAENQRLKRIVARQALETDAYKEVAEGNGEPGHAPPCLGPVARKVHLAQAHRQPPVDEIVFHPL